MLKVNIKKITEECLLMLKKYKNCKFIDIINSIEMLTNSMLLIKDLKRKSLSSQRIHEGN